MNQGLPVQETTREIKSLVRSALRTLWGKAFVCYFIYQCAIAFLPKLITIFIPALSKTYTIEYMGIQSAIQYSYLPLFFIVIFGGPFKLSLSKIYLGIIRERNVDIKNIFWGLKFFFKAFATWVLIIIAFIVSMVPIAAVTGLIASLFMGLGGVLTAIGTAITSLGMIVATIVGLLCLFTLTMSFYVHADNISVKPFEALRSSLGIMKPNIFRLAVLRISYIGWVLIALIVSANFENALTMALPSTNPIMIVIINIIGSIPIILVDIYMEMGDAFFYEFAIGHLRKTGSSPVAPAGFKY